MLSIRYLHPVSINHMAVVSARLTKSSSPLYYLEAKISQDGKVLAKATGKFMDRSRKTRSEMKKS